jgi:hypothetical protein
MCSRRLPIAWCSWWYDLGLEAGSGLVTVVFVVTPPGAIYHFFIRGSGSLVTIGSSSSASSGHSSGQPQMKSSECRLDFFPLFPPLFFLNS